MYLFIVHHSIQLFVCGKWREALVYTHLQGILNLFIVLHSALMENTWQVDPLTNVSTFGQLRSVLHLNLFIRVATQLGKHKIFNLKNRKNIRKFENFLKNLENYSYFSTD